MNLIIDIWDYTLDQGNERSWEDIAFAQGVPVPAMGEVIYLPKQPDKKVRPETIPFRVIRREFHLDKARGTAEPVMRVALYVEEFDDREYAS